MVFIKGDGDIDRDPDTREWLKEIRTDNFKYKRFGNILELQREVRTALLKLLHDRFHLVPSTDEETIAEQTIEAVSPFESQALKRLQWKNLDHRTVRHFVSQADQISGTDLTESAIRDTMLVRGLLWFDPEINEIFATAAGIVLFGKDPSAVFPHCRFLADAYRGTEPDGDPIDHSDIRGPMPQAIDQVVNFIDRNTRHPMKVVGLDRVRLDEYPAEALREALVNAVAHRNYEDAGRKIMVEVFPDRVVISSPGLPPKPLTLQKLRSGRYKPCSRNPVIAQSLSYFHRIEERGSGFKRMRAAMVDHGLEEPILTEDTGYFQVIFIGPGKDLARIKAVAAKIKPSISISIERQLNTRQKKIVRQVMKKGFVTSGWCRKYLKVTYDTANRDFAALMAWGIVKKVGSGPGTRYEFVSPK